MFRIFSAAIALLLIPALTFADAAEPTIQRVSLFKNGLGYFQTTVQLPDAKTINIGQLPVPSHGTFWLGYEPDLPLVAAISGASDQAESQPVQSITDLLRANVGSTVQIVMADQTPISGKLLRVLTPEAPEPANPYRMGATSTDARHRNTYYHHPNAAMAMVETATGIVTVNTSVAQQVRIDGQPKLSFDEHQKRPSVRLELREPAAGKTVAIDYLARGITWAPSYLIDLSNDKTATLSAKAVIINEVADLDGAAIELISGFPNLQFADVNSPIALSQSLEQFMNGLQNRRSTSERASDVMRQAVVFNRADYSQAGPVPQYSTAAVGQQAEDLFFYPIQKLTLARGETATVPLFSADCPYHHLYTWAIPDYVDEHNRYRHDDSDANESPEEVWHAVRLTNATKQPLTTAPTQFVKDGRIVGQDICYFTNPGDETTIRVNRTMKIVAEQAEQETARERNAARFYGSTYDLVTVKGELKLKSFFAKPVKMEITKMLSGEVVTTSDDPKVTPTAEGLRRVNPRQRVIWDLNLQPGETTLTYTYKLYVRG